jgi:hypothetical protein
MYASKAEKAKAYRLRQKMKMNREMPDINELARAVHRIYKQRAESEVGYAQHLVGKSPFETLLRVVLYDVLYENHAKDGDADEFPGWDKLIQPIDIAGKNGTSYEVCGVKNPAGVMIYLPHEAAFFGDGEDGDKQSDA